MSKKPNQHCQSPRRQEGREEHQARGAGQGEEGLHRGLGGAPLGAGHQGRRQGGARPSASSASAAPPPGPPATPPSTRPRARARAAADAGAHRQRPRHHPRPGRRRGRSRPRTRRASPHNQTQEDPAPSASGWRRSFFEIGLVLSEIQADELYRFAKELRLGFEAFLEREIDLGKQTSLKLIVKVAHTFQQDAALDYGMDRLLRRPLRPSKAETPIPKALHPLRPRLPAPSCRWRPDADRRPDQERRPSGSASLAKRRLTERRPFCRRSLGPRAAPSVGRREPSMAFLLSSPPRDHSGPLRRGAPPRPGARPSAARSVQLRWTAGLVEAGPRGSCRSTT